MELKILTWRGLNINEGSPYRTTFPIGQLVNLNANAILVPRANRFPKLSGRVLTGRAYVLRVVIAPTYDIPTYREVLKNYFNIEDETTYQLIAEDLSDSNRQWYLTGNPTRLIETSPGLYTIHIQVEEPVWKVVVPLTDTWNITASGQTHTVTAIGNTRVAPVFNFIPTSAKTGGLTYRRWIPIYNNMDTGINVPLDITDGGLDTSALVGGGKMQADGDDFRVWLDGTQVDRWLDAMNTAATKCWVNVPYSPRKQGTTSVSISNVGLVSAISFTHNRSNRVFLEAMVKVANKVVLIDDEAFTFTNVNLSTYQLTGCTRAQKDTTADTHNTPSTVHWIEHDLWILYGDNTLSAPDVDDTLKPIFDLDSINEAWGFTNFYDKDSFRPGAWKGEVNATRTGLSYTFTGFHNIFASPSTELGLALVGSTDFQVQNESGQLDWLFSHPASVTQVVYSVDKYMTNSWPAIVGLQNLIPSNAVWFTAQNEVAPSATLIWESGGPTTVVFDNPSTSIRFVIDGLISSAIGAMALAQFDGVTVTFDNANLPTFGMGAETEMYYFDFTLTNDATDEYIQVTAQCLLNDVLTIDCDTQSAYLSDGTNVLVFFSSNRATWLDLLSGANQLQYDDAGTNAVTLDTEHVDRML